VLSPYIKKIGTTEIINVEQIAWAVGGSGFMSWSNLLTSKCAFVALQTNITNLTCKSSLFK